MATPLVTFCLLVSLIPLGNCVPFPKKIGKSPVNLGLKTGIRTQMDRHATSQGRGMQGKHVFMTPRVKSKRGLSARCLGDRMIDQWKDDSWEDWEESNFNNEIEELREDNGFMEAIESANSGDEMLDMMLRSPPSLSTAPAFAASLKRALLKIDPITFPKLCTKLLHARQTAESLDDLSKLSEALGKDPYSTGVAREKFKIQRSFLKAVSHGILENAGWEDFRSFEMADIAWAFAVIGVKDVKLFTWMQDGIHRTPNWQYTTSSIAKLVFAWCTLKEDPNIIIRLLVIGSAPNFMEKYSREDVGILFTALEAIDVEDLAVGGASLIAVMGEFLPLLRARFEQLEAEELEKSSMSVSW